MILALQAATALACGGFFCNNSQPVDQTAERILFAQDPTTGEVETHIQIFYEGPSEDFAWVVPVPGVPEIFVSSDELFNDLSSAYAPQFTLDDDEEVWCTWPSYNDGGSGGWYGGGGWSGSGGYYYYSGGGSGYGGSTYYTPPVVVVDTATVGAYETVTLQATDSEALLEWLLDNDFDLPSNLGPALDPYVAGGSYFVAMRMVKDSDDGAIQPIGFRYRSGGISIPIQLTSIAALPDMRLEVYVLGDYRAVPESYLHVQINEAAIDWFKGGTNYDEVVTRAANEAGGHGFATDYAGPSDLPSPTWYDRGRYDTAAIAAATTPAAAIFETQSQFRPTDFLLTILEEFVPPPQGVSATNFYNSPSSYPLLPGYTWDGPGLAAALEERIVEPMVRTGDLFERYPVLTRLTSSLDAAEMTVDPVFALNREMAQQVSRLHSATHRILCGNGGDGNSSPRELELSDGRIYPLPSYDDLGAMGLTESDYLDPDAEKAAIVIEQTSGTEAPIVIVDYSSTGTSATPSGTTTPVGKVEGEGCGCTSAPSPAGLLALALLLPWTRRRRC